MQDIVEKLIEKSKEAFLLGVETYNRPTVKYRVEAFGFYICNAWELMLKAYLIKSSGEQSIYYKDNRDRTLSINDCIRKVFTNDKDPLRINLEKIIELRNTSTHFIVEEYETIYVPLFQACVNNYSDKMADLLGEDISTIIPLNFLALSSSFAFLSPEEITAKYPNSISNRIFSIKKSIDSLSFSNNDKFAITIDVHHYLTKDPKKASDVYRIASEGEIPIAVMKDPIDISNKYKFTHKALINQVEKRLERKGVVLQYNGASVTFNKYHCTNFIKYFEFKNNSAFAWKHEAGPNHYYSVQAVDFIVSQLSSDPNNILDKIAQKKISHPQGQRNSQ